MPSTSGSFVSGNQSARMTDFNFFTPDRRMDSSSYVQFIIVKDPMVLEDKVVAAYTTSFDGNVQASTASVSTSIGTRRATFGSTEGILIAYDTTLDGEGSFGRHLQVGVTKSISDGSPSSPC